MNGIDFLLYFDGDLDGLIYVCEYELSLSNDDYQYQYG